jgi:quinoprotein dehydrogenase-associated probable ABC transporter substrate-binding protein
VATASGIALLAAMGLLAVCAPPAAAQQAETSGAPVAGTSTPTTHTRPPHTFRVCADPDNMPAADDKLEGFDNKIAALFAKDLGDAVTYTWWPTRRGFVRNTLSSSDCDVVFGVPKGYDLVLATKPYYRSAYVAVTRRDRHLTITSLDDSALKSLKIGVTLFGDDYTNTPPAQALGARGINQRVVGFTSFYNSEHRPSEIVEAVAKGQIDVALAWGPLAGYFAKHSAVPLDLTVLPDTDRATGFPFAYDLTLGVRRADRGLRDTLNMLIDRHRADIDAILRDYGVPVLPLTTESASQ